MNIRPGNILKVQVDAKVLKQWRRGRLGINRDCRDTLLLYRFVEAEVLAPTLGYNQPRRHLSKTSIMTLISLLSLLEKEEEPPVALRFLILSRLKAREDAEDFVCRNKISTHHPPHLQSYELDRVHELCKYYKHLWACLNVASNDLQLLAWSDYRWTKQLKVTVFEGGK